VADGIAPPKKVTLSLIGLDGNAFNLLGHFQRAAREQGWSTAEIKSVLADATSSDYDHLLQVLLRHTVPLGDDPQRGD
jgi:hypothetical protein